jgi:hypothetical protein
MKSERWQDREKAFNQMPSLAEISKRDPQEADRLKSGLIRLLSTESTEVKKAQGLGEEHSENYGNLVSAVSRLDDERAIPALVGAITTGGIATRALARFGEKALSQMVGQISSPDPDVRSSVLFTIRDLLEMQISLTAGSQARIKDVLRSSLDDPEFSVRGGAMAAIEYLEDREQFVPALEKVAQSDPVRLPGKPDDGGDGGQFFPLRQQARKLLRKIANHEAPVIDRGISD